MNWLIARDAFAMGGDVCIQTLVDADEALLEAFCADWKDADPKFLRLAYAAYQDSLLKMQEPEPIVIPMNLNDMPVS